MEDTHKPQVFRLCIYVWSW